VRFASRRYDVDIREHDDTTEINFRAIGRQRACNCLLQMQTAVRSIGLANCLSLFIRFGQRGWTGRRSNAIIAAKGG
jgi:hypothetical protein